jgi:hypothetical protein
MTISFPLIHKIFNFNDSTAKQYATFQVYLKIQRVKHASAQDLLGGLHHRYARKLRSTKADCPGLSGDDEHSRGKVVGRRA